VYGTGYNYHHGTNTIYARPWTWDSMFTMILGRLVVWRRLGTITRMVCASSNETHAGWWGPAEYHPVYHPATKPVYREGYHPAYRQIVSSAPAVRSPNEVRRTSGVIALQPFMIRSSGVRRPVAIATPRPSREVTRTTPTEPRQPEARPITRPVTPTVPQPERRIIVTRSSTKENNVYVAPNGNIMRSTPQGWQQRDQNTWKKADETPAKQAIVRDSNVRQRATERSSRPRLQHLRRSGARTNKDKKR